MSNKLSEKNEAESTNYGTTKALKKVNLKIINAPKQCHVYARDTVTYSLL